MNKFEFISSLLWRVIIVSFSGKYPILLIILQSLCENKKNAKCYSIQSFHVDFEFSLTKVSAGQFLLRMKIIFEICPQVQVLSAPWQLTK